MSSEEFFAAILTLAPFLGYLIACIVIAPKIPQWYEKLIKPCWCPSEDGVIIIWITCYLLGGFSSYLIYRDGGGLDGPARLPLILYSVQLTLTWMWRLISHGTQSFKWAFYCILLISVLTLGCCCQFKSINETAFYLMIPYVVWAIYATSLTYTCWGLNSNPARKKKLN